MYYICWEVRYSSLGLFELSLTPGYQSSILISEVKFHACNKNKGGVGGLQCFLPRVIIKLCSGASITVLNMYNLKMLGNRGPVMCLLFTSFDHSQKNCMRWCTFFFICILVVNVSFISNGSHVPCPHNLKTTIKFFWIVRIKQSLHNFSWQTFFINIWHFSLKAGNNYNEDEN